MLRLVDEFRTTYHVPVPPPKATLKGLGKRRPTQTHQLGLVYVILAIIWYEICTIERLDESNGEESAVFLILCVFSFPRCLI